MKFARDGIPTIITIAVLVVASYFVSHILALILCIPLALVVWFFRDPERTPERELKRGDFLSPADGRVVEIEHVCDKKVGDTTKIGIFMNAFSVHVNRFPTNGTVESTEYVPGKKWFAFAPKASEINERFYVVAKSEFGRFMLVQIAGILARRIVPRAKRGNMYNIGERYGMIKLGSKVDIYLPEAIRPAVKIGDKVYAGYSIIGVLNDEKQ